jgi:hypothetical protein
MLSLPRDILMEFHSGNFYSVGLCNNILLACKSAVSDPSPHFIHKSNRFQRFHSNLNTSTAACNNEDKSNGVSNRGVSGVSYMQPKSKLFGTVGIKSIAINPVRPYLIALGCADSFVRVYDIRSLQNKTRDLAAHCSNMARKVILNECMKTSVYDYAKGMDLPWVAPPATKSKSNANANFDLEMGVEIGMGIDACFGVDSINQGSAYDHDDFGTVPVMVFCPESLAPPVPQSLNVKRRGKHKSLFEHVLTRYHKFYRLNDTDDEDDIDVESDPEADRVDEPVYNRIHSGNFFRHGNCKTFEPRKKVPFRRQHPHASERQIFSHRIRKMQNDDLNNFIPDAEIEVDYNPTLSANHLSRPCSYVTFSR